MGAEEAGFDFAVSSDPSSRGWTRWATRGDDVDAVIEAAKEYSDAGFANLALMQIGGDQQGPFLKWSRSTLTPAWREVFGSSPSPGGMPRQHG